jgi:hypothetical protein
VREKAALQHALNESAKFQTTVRDWKVHEFPNADLRKPRPDRRADSPATADGSV